MLADTGARLCSRASILKWKMNDENEHTLDCRPFLPSSPHSLCWPVARRRRRKHRLLRMLPASAAPQSEMSAKERDRAIGQKDGRTAEEVIAAIDSSGWAVNPLDYGMSAMDYERAEAELLFGNFAKRAGGVNKFFHFPGLTKADDRWVVSVNNDTIYSVATVDAREGFSVTVPDVGERFLSIHIQDFNHTIVDYTWSPGTHHYPADACRYGLCPGRHSHRYGRQRGGPGLVREQLQPNFQD